MMTAPTDTHRRAAIRGREAVAQWRIKSGVWAARLFAVLFAVISVLPLLRRDAPDWVGGIIVAVIAVAILVASQMLSRGNRIAAIVLVTAFAGAKLASWLVAKEPIYQGALWTVIIAGALANGVWGAFELAAVRRDAALIPPAAPRDAARPVRQAR
jgi:hypothetical protein